VHQTQLQQASIQVVVQTMGVQQGSGREHPRGISKGRIFRFGEQLNHGGGGIGAVNREDRNMCIDEPLHNEALDQLNTLQGRGRLELESSQLRLLLGQVGGRPILDLNRPQRSRSWSMGMVSTLERNEQDLQMVLELRTEDPFYSPGTMLRSRSRGHRDMASYASWLSSQGIRANIPTASIQPRLSSRLQKRALSTALGSQQQAERIQNHRSRPNGRIASGSKNVFSIPTPPPPQPIIMKITIISQNLQGLNDYRFVDLV
jgi:hypothetical protein